MGPNSCTLSMLCCPRHLKSSSSAGEYRFLPLDYKINSLLLLLTCVTCYLHDLNRIFIWYTCFAYFLHMVYMICSICKWDAQVFGRKRRKKLAENKREKKKKKKIWAAVPMECCVNTSEVILSASMCSIYFKEASF